MFRGTANSKSFFPAVETVDESVSAPVEALSTRRFTPPGEQLRGSVHSQRNYVLYLEINWPGAMKV